MAKKNENGAAPENEMKASIGKMNFEQATARLEEIVKLLEKGDAPLDDMLSLYEEGAALLKRANALLEDAEQRIAVVAEEEK